MLTMQKSLVVASLFILGMFIGLMAGLNAGFGPSSSAIALVSDLYSENTSLQLEILELKLDKLELLSNDVGVQMESAPEQEGSVHEYMDQGEQFDDVGDHGVVPGTSVTGPIVELSETTSD